jgi:hypothetical protein
LDDVAEQGRFEDFCIAGGRGFARGSCGLPEPEKKQGATGITTVAPHIAG